MLKGMNCSLVRSKYHFTSSLNDNRLRTLYLWMMLKGMNGSLVRSKVLHFLAK